MKICVVGDVLDVITYTKFRNEIYKNELKFDKLQQTANTQSHAATSNFDRSYDMSVDVVDLRLYLRLAYA